MVPTKRILVPGGYGFLGSHLVKEISKNSDLVAIPVSHSECDFTSQTDTDKLFSSIKPDYVINVAAKVGGIGANIASPATFYYDNVMINTNIVHYSYKYNVQKLVNVGTVCSYPSNTPVPFRESDLWNGFPEISNSPYGIAKKASLIQQQAYEKQYGFKSAYLIPVNLYGPHDDFDDATSHVIPALIKKMVHAVENRLTTVECWGTGIATREFLYVEDCARMVLRALWVDSPCQPVNMGSFGGDVSIKTLAELIASLVGYNLEIKWDDTKPDGQLRRNVNSALYWTLYNECPKVTLADGLKRTIDWYRSNNQ